ncbi:alpha/beta-hydrolase [Violaceomyces palustris]|uniref:Alpha/beta-hydrolase n=1 Tax=Violaceomyces palustris TaxID=1673888 RepID=A0ACD0NU12_9BASI|nr:alpha/beta-hydrolase [Violaceomyces palustris]
MTRALPNWLGLVQSLSLLCLGLASATSAADPANLLTAERLISAPRPGTAVVSPESTSALIGTSSYSFQDHFTSKVLYSIALSPSQGLQPASSLDTSTSAASSTSQPVVPVAYNATSGFYLSDTEAAFLIGDTLYAKNLSAGTPDPKDPGFRIGAFPAPVDNIQIVRVSDTSAVLVFSASVYDDGKLENVLAHDQSEIEQEWNRVKVYEDAMVRHWDTWVNPRKRYQLFSVELSKKKEGFETTWHFNSGFRNLMQGTKLECPVPPFGGSDDFALSDRFVAWTSKDPRLSKAWHTKQNIYVAPLDASEPPRKVSSGEHGWAGAPTFSPDGESLLWLQMRKDGFESDRRIIQSYSLNTNRHKEILGAWDSSPSKLVFSRDGSTLYILSEDDEQDKVFSYHLSKGLASDEPKEIVSQGGTSSIEPLKNGGLIITSSSLTSPNDVYSVSKSGEIRRLTNFGRESDALGKVDFGPQPEQFVYAGSEGQERHGWIIRPPGFDESKKYPVAVLIHGGPEGAWTNSWSTRWNPMVFAAQGFLVVTLDPAGSTGFGQEYTEAILGNWGGRPYYDIRAGVHYVLDVMPSADSERVVAAGASYGGYMINWLQGHNDDELFKALVCHDGVFDTKNTFYSTDELYFPEAEFGGVPWEVSSEYEKWSPQQHTSNWKTPQLVIHGGKDYRLTESEGLSAFNVLQRRGVPSKLVYFPDENHWVLNPRNSLKWHEEVLGWLKKWSKAEDDVAVDQPALAFQSKY